MMIIEFEPEWNTETLIEVSLWRVVHINFGWISKPNKKTGVKLFKIVSLNKM